MAGGAGARNAERGLARQLRRAQAQGGGCCPSCRFERRHYGATGLGNADDRTSEGHAESDGHTTSDGHATSDGQVGDVLRGHVEGGSEDRHATNESPVSEGNAKRVNQR